MATAINREKDARMDFRLRPDFKERIEKAASVSGKSVTEFAVSTLLKTADEILERYHVAELSNRDRDLFLSILDQETKPNEKLLRAAKTHEKLIVK
ncbi:MAG: DUF1778 domain-containing protein [Pyrinomonadaceae bacterium]